ncbi:alpha/beta hydrolase [Hymenobacter chitinivorans]|uniref:Alpha-beta hydrolase superfamily lysophospholipase n=1 Tax=Hymenobacter chitinivorans DSM 11115 TaxID=1121954 RepID=A0A2M9AQA0_9BACT|nr:alpha/beta hydrolase [Hymenobacter chitinivorans]PJJ47881.1 alpha-beta hydrolase superfamily lysophospholipase [Hymenobacter chitinivorans DSM 11115]
MAESHYQPDVLGPDFEQRVIEQPADYEGMVVCTLVRLREQAPGPRAVLYVHGFTDYFFQRDMAREYHRHGFRFYALDLRKYGRSWRPHQTANNVRDLAEYYPDLDAALALMRAEGCATIVLSGHSTGGLIAALYAQDGTQRQHLAALFLNSPFLDMHQNWLNRTVGVPLAARLGRWLPDVQLPANLPTEYGRSLHRQYQGEWDYHLPWKPIEVFPVKLGWLRAIHAGHRRVARGLHLAQPILVLHSDQTVTQAGWSEQYFEADGVLNVCHIRELSPRLGPRVTVQAIAGGIHDLVLSRPAVRARVYQVLFEWLNKVLPDLVCQPERSKGPA